MGRWVAVDPGEDTGLAICEGESLVDAHTIKLWDVADLIWYAVDYTKWMRGGGVEEDYIEQFRQTSPHLIDPFSQLIGRDLERIVCEDWRIYPWEAKSLSWDQCRTARLIGALTFICRLHEIDFVLQGANIKERAVAGGAEELFFKPLHENRHQNDAIMHYWYYVQTELRKGR